MKKISRKKLNNKGFTLVELLAVVVILAVVMGIATTAVISSMNNSRKGSLNDSAISVKNAFITKYSESMVTGTTVNIYKDEMSLSTATGYDFTIGTKESPVFYELNEALKDELNLSPSTYRLDQSTSLTKMTADASGNYNADTSFIAFNGNTVVVCLIAKNEGSYYVANFAETGSTKNATVFGKTVNFGTTPTGGTFDDKQPAMWSCSTDNTNSW